ncbi:sensor histidine kinase [Metaclostridioides mangenotii]|uniref:sensor histidine kinase n=1 Tax=Metaclostridioides mangenotii TaxID=1540 RepID=UPI0004803932|nr:sensor histidine kinase [Clostridioides mangenotii]
MVNLFIPLLERVGLIIILAYILLNINYFKVLLKNRDVFSTKVKFIVIFSAFAIISNFTGVEVNGESTFLNGFLLKVGQHSSIANTRVLTIGVSGLIGGPFVGFFVGMISSTVRLIQGGDAAYTYFVSSVLVGFFSGYFGRKSLRKNTFPSVKEGMIIGVIMECIQMICIVIFKGNINGSVELLKIIALPMILINGIGTGIFLSIISSTLRQEESALAVQTHDVLELANHTLPFFRSGLNEESCKEAAIYICKFLRVSAVSITDNKRILAHVGAGSDHHIPSFKILTDLSKSVIQTGRIKVANSPEEIGCNHNGCPLKAAIVVPLHSSGEVVGTFKLYFTDPTKLTFVERQLAEGLGEIFSSQIEFGEIEIQNKLQKDAEIKSLQAQVNPHFFFNAINTISALIRIDSEQGRRLLLQLSKFFRSNLQGARRNLITLEEELEQVRAYLSIEQARFPNKYTVEFQVEESMNDYLLPPFVIQILVENALKHAFGSRKNGNNVWVKVTDVKGSIRFEVKDNGFGIDESKIEKLGKDVVESESGTGSAIENLNKRLKSLFSDSSALQFETSSSGTTISCNIPKREFGGV